MSINFYIILKVIFLLRLVQNFGYIPHVVQYIPEPLGVTQVQGCIGQHGEYSQNSVLTVKEK